MELKKQVLFVCKANIGRSQIAEGLFEKYNKNPYHIATSAGTHVGEYDGVLLKNYPGTQSIITLMNHEKINLRNKTRKQLTEKLVNESDIIIVMNDFYYCPDYLINTPRTINWDIPDPKHRDYNFLYETKEKIKENILSLIDRI